MKNLLFILIVLIPVSVWGQSGQRTDTKPREQGVSPDKVTFSLASSLLFSPQNVIVPVEELPKTITDNVARDHSGFTVKKAEWDWSTTLVPGNIFVYRIVITDGKKDQLLLYNKEGKFLTPGTVVN